LKCLKNIGFSIDFPFLKHYIQSGY
jgi:hypothetical protein